MWDKDGEKQSGDKRQKVRGQIPSRIDWFDLLAVQVTPIKSLLLHYNSKAPIL